MRTLNPGNNGDDKRKFYKKVYSSVVAHLIKDILSVTGYDDLLLQQDKFAFYNDAIGEMEFDGATMIYLIFMKTDPSTAIGIDSFLKKLDTTNLGYHSNCVDTMLTIREGHYKNLRENSLPPEHFRRLVLDALSTGPNYLFNDFVRRITEDVESGIGSNANITSDALITACRTKYNKMVENKDWHKVDPRDAQIIALTTIMENMKSKSGGTVLVTKADAYKEETTNNEFINGIERWRTVNTEKTKVVKGRTYYWCPHHVKEGMWNGIYVTHKPKDHKRKIPNSQRTTVAATQGTDGAAKKEDKSNGASTLKLQ